MARNMKKPRITGKNGRWMLYVAVFAVSGAIASTVSNAATYIASGEAEGGDGSSWCGSRGSRTGSAAT